MLRPLTSEEMLDVNLASKGENTSHRRWPKEIVEAFLAAEVVTINHSELHAGTRRAARPVSVLSALSTIITAPLAIIPFRRLF